MYDILKLLWCAEFSDIGVLNGVREWEGVRDSGMEGGRESVRERERVKDREWTKEVGRVSACAHKSVKERVMRLTR